MVQKEQILEKYSVISNQFGWCLPPDQARKALDEYAEPILKALYQAIGAIEVDSKDHFCLDNLKKVFNFYKK